MWLYRVFNKAFKEVESNTLLPLLHALVLDLRILSIRVAAPAS